jgi:hypothetical protein
MPTEIPGPLQLRIPSTHGRGEAFPMRARPSSGSALRKSAIGLGMASLFMRGHARSGAVGSRTNRESAPAMSEGFVPGHLPEKMRPDTSPAAHTSAPTTTTAIRNRNSTCSQGSSRARLTGNVGVWMLTFACLWSAPPSERRCRRLRSRLARCDGKRESFAGRPSTMRLRDRASGANWPRCRSAQGARG